MDWRDQLREIVQEAKQVPTFEEWLMKSGYEEIPELLLSPIEGRSIIQTLYARYQRIFRRAA